MADLIAGIAPQVDTYANWVSANPTLGKDSSGKSFNQMIFATGSPVGDILIWGNDQTFTASYAAGQYVIQGITLLTYDTGWVANSDWTTAVFTVTHALSTDMSDLIVKFFVSTDGTEANAFEIHSYDSGAAGTTGLTLFQNSTNEVAYNTGATGLRYVASDGTAVTLAAQSYYYKVKVYKLS